jgi:hypothetical protein
MINFLRRVVFQIVSLGVALSVGAQESGGGSAVVPPAPSLESLQDSQSNLPAENNTIQQNNSPSTTPTKPATKKLKKRRQARKPKTVAGSKSPTRVQVRVTRPARPVIPPPTRYYRPVIDLPTTFTVHPAQTEKRVVPQVEIEERERRQLNSKVIVEDYIVEEAFEPVAVVTEFDDANKTAAPGHIAFLEADEPLSIGDELYAYREVETDLDGGGDPIIVLSVATVRIVRIFDNDGDPLYKGLIVNGIRQLEIGDQLVRAPLPRVDLKTPGNPTNVRADVVIDEANHRRRLGNYDKFIFLNKGSEDGLSEGALLSVLANPQSRNMSSKYNLPTRSVALIRVVKVSPNYATALVLSAKDAIYAGDYTDSPERFDPVANPVPPRKIIDITDEASDEWAVFRPFMNIPIPLTDEQEARRVPLFNDPPPVIKSEAELEPTAEEDPAPSDFDSEDGYVDGGD